MLVTLGDGGARTVAGIVAGSVFTLIGVGVFFDAIPSWAESMIYGDQ